MQWGSPNTQSGLLGLFLLKHMYMKQLLFILSFLLVSTVSFGQQIQALSPDEEKTFDFAGENSMALGLESKIMLDSEGDLLVYFIPGDYPLRDVDSVTVTVGKTKKRFDALTPYLIKGIEKEVGFKKLRAL